MEHSNIPTAKPDKVYIANFGRNNYLWPKCLEKSSIATLEDEDLRALWLAGDKDGYIKLCMNEKRSAAGIRPPASLASRWFNLAKIVSSTSGDMWIHRAKDTLWWTISGHGSISQELHPASLPTKPDTNVWEIHKPARAWMPEDMRGARLSWSALHPRAKEFLFTEGTMQRLSDDHAAYALALVSGKDLKEWHGRELWARKEVASKNPRGSILGARERSIAMMANTVEDTVRGSNGQTVERTVKNKESRFESKGALRKYLSDLLETQGGQCAISGLALQHEGACDDSALLCSLDRIDSDGHYEVGNLQIVCRFVNRWKSDTSDSEFRRLFEIVLDPARS